MVAKPPNCLHLHMLMPLVLVSKICEE